MRRKLLLLVLLLPGAACQRTTLPRFTAPVKLGGKVVAASVLTAGAQDYTLYCRSCHGDLGDGKGPAAPGLFPPPRDFRAGIFKFGAVAGGALPSDDDLVRIVRSGLHGTAMLGWDGIPEANVRGILQYVKTFSPRWKEEEPGEVVATTPDPWVGKEAAGIARGRKVYHGFAQCLGCHPSYAPRKFVYEATKELTGNNTTDFRDDMYGSVLKESDFGVKLLPPDFTFSDLRSVRPGHRLEDLYRVVASGVGGTAMPSWKGALPEEDLWALVHYVSSLVDERGTEAPRKRLEENLAADASWKPPALPSSG